MLVLLYPEMTCRFDTTFRSTSSYRSTAVAAPPGGNVATDGKGLLNTAQDFALHTLAHAARLRSVQGRCLRRPVLLASRHYR